MKKDIKKFCEDVFGDAWDVIKWTLSIAAIMGAFWLMDKVFNLIDNLP